MTAQPINAANPGYISSLYQTGQDTVNWAQRTVRTAAGTVSNGLRNAWEATKHVALRAFVALASALNTVKNSVVSTKDAFFAAPREVKVVATIASLATIAAAFLIGRWTNEPAPVAPAVAIALAPAAGEGAPAAAAGADAAAPAAAAVAGDAAAPAAAAVAGDAAAPAAAAAVAVPAAE